MLDALRKDMSYAEIIRSMLDSIPQSDHEVSEALEKILKMKPELAETT